MLPHPFQGCKGEVWGGCGGCMVGSAHLAQVCKYTSQVLVLGGVRASSFHACAFPFCCRGGVCVPSTFQWHFSFSDNFSAFSLHTASLSNLLCPAKMSMVWDAHTGCSGCWCVQGHHVPDLAPARSFPRASLGRTTPSPLCFPFPSLQPRSPPGFMEVLRSSSEPCSPQQPTP